MPMGWPSFFGTYKNTMLIVVLIFKPWLLKSYVVYSLGWQIFLRSGFSFDVLFDEVVDLNLEGTFHAG